MFIGHCNWAMIILNGMLYEMLMLFQGKRLVIVCSKQFRILIKMQSNFAKNPFFVLFKDRTPISFAHPFIIEFMADYVKSTLCCSLRPYGMQSMEAGVGQVPATSRAAERAAARATDRASMRAQERAAQLPVIV